MQCLSEDDIAALSKRLNMVVGVIALISPISSNIFKPALVEKEWPFSRDENMDFGVV